MIDKNDIKEFHKSTVERQKELALNEAAKKAAINKKRDEFYSKYYNSLNERAIKENEHNSLLSSARNNALGTCIKAIYISALEANTLSDEGRALAERLVDNYISEKGGAEKIFNECADRSYLLSRLSCIVEDSAKEETEEIENIDVDTLGEEEEDEAKTTEDEISAEEDEAIEDIDKALDTPVEEESTEDEKKDSESDEDESKEEDETSDDSKSDDDDDKEDDEPDDDDDEKEESEGEENLRTAGSTDDDIDTVEDEENIDSKLDNTKSEDSDDNTSEDNNEEDIDSKLDNDESSDDEGDVAPEEDEGAEEDSEEDVVIDNDEDDGSKDASVNDTDEDGESDSTIYDELEDEEDVQKAVELIRNRVADAEEAFIKRNAKDKQTMDDLLNKISDNVKTVEKIADNDSVKSKIAQESVQAAHRQIGELHNKPQFIFEAMVRNLSSSIVKDDDIKKNYLNESGAIDMGSVIESAKIMYAFLETLNTLQFEKVDGEYIKKVLSEI